MSNLIEKRIVIKVGTSTLTHSGGELNFRSFDRLALTLADIQNLGYEVVLVSSGAIAVGAYKLRMEQRPTLLRYKQAAAAIGQCELMHLYDKFFSEYGKVVAQILLTGDDVGNAEKRQSLINTIDTLLEMGIIPIINENDSVGYSEIESDAKIFGDNDMLSAIVATLCGASRLILLSDIDGLYETDPRLDPDAKLIPRIHAINDGVRALAGGSGSNRGTGGMITKLQAAETAMTAGVDMVIMNGQRPEKILDYLGGAAVGTLFTGG